MYRPATGELLGRVCAGLETSVLPTVTDGGGRRQLKAAIHLLRRLERSWDRLPEYLADDNRDMLTTIGGVFATSASLPVSQEARWQELRVRFSTLSAAAADAEGGNGTAGTARPAEVNTALQQILETLDDILRSSAGRSDAALMALYRRMVAREMHALATGAADDE